MLIKPKYRYFYRINNFFVYLIASAVKHDPQLKEYYVRKKEEAKNAMLVLNNVKL
jgi:hypothetical protein